MHDGGSRAYFAASHAFHDFMIVRPSDAPHDLGVCTSDAEAESIGIAYPASWVPVVDEGGRAAALTWRLVVHHVELPGRFTLRRGKCVRLE